MGKLYQKDLQKIARSGFPTSHVRFHFHFYGAFIRNAYFCVVRYKNAPMNTKRILLVCCLLIMALAAKAQRLSGLSIEGEYTKMVVVLNGQQMCEGTTSCFIANLSPGTYNVQVFRADEMQRHAAARRPLYQDRIRYSGRGVQRIHVADRHFDDGFNRYPHRGVMNKADFKDYCHALKKLSFDNRRMEMLDRLPRHTQFTSRQCRDIIREFSFDDNRAKALQKLYPRVVDQEMFFKAIDALDFRSNQKEVLDFIQRYHQRH